MDGLNHHADVMRQHLTECFVDLCRFGLAPQPSPELGLNHVKDGFDVAALVIVRLEFVNMEVESKIRLSRAFTLTDILEALCKEREQFAKEFDEGAARLVTEQGRTIADAARSFGLSPWTMSRRVRAARTDGAAAFRGHGQRTPAEQENFELRQKVK